MMQRNLLKVGGSLALMALVALGTGSAASAATITVAPQPLITGINPAVWSYSLTLEGNSTIETGNFFTIQDFAGFNGVTTAPAGWTFSSSNTGVCPIDAFSIACAATDDAAIPNLTWTRTGAPIVGGGVGAVVQLGNFIAQSIFITPINSQWYSQDHDLQTNTFNEGAGGNTNTPVGTAVPEPASLLLLGSGLLGLAYSRRKARS